MLNEAIGAILQVIAFSLIPLLVYLVQNKKTQGFLENIGLYGSNANANFYAFLTSLVFLVPMIIMTMVNSDFREIMFDPMSITGKIRLMGFGTEAVGTILIIALIKTALAEEIFFRGFLAKRLIRTLGFPVGNWIHAIIFGLIHAALFATITSNILFLAVIFVFPTIGAYLMAYLNEKMAEGSIMPGWISHACANVLSYSIVGFLL